jgi:hypothetical protein
MGAVLFDVIIAQCNDTWWCLKGSEHLDDLLAATEATELTISLVIGKKWNDVVHLWDAPQAGGMPWAINPLVIERLKARQFTTIS